MKVIAVDFDGCLCEDKWPDIGEPNQHVINALAKRQSEGAKIILWTCREGQHLQAAVMWCLNHGLKFDAINDNLEENKAAYGNNCRKVWADEYWDDKAITIAPPSLLKALLSEIEGDLLPEAIYEIPVEPQSDSLVERVAKCWRWLLNLEG